MWNRIQATLLVVIALCLPARASAQMSVANITGSATPVSDLNGDGKADLLYRNYRTGLIYLLLMDGFSIVGEGPIYVEPNRGWQIVGYADFNGDGVTDLLWRNVSSSGMGAGFVYMQLFNSAGVPESGSVFWIEPNYEWQIVGTPDFDGDGKADILWRNFQTGQVYAMQMDGPRIVAQANIYTEPDYHWQIVGVGDFSGSGKRNQILWHNDGYSAEVGDKSGQVYLMTVTLSGGVFSQTGQVIYQEPAVYWWEIKAVADFNGDGKSDILWRRIGEGTTDAVYILFMDGPRVAGGGPVSGFPQPSYDWYVSSVADYNGDGKADILLRNPRTGHVYMMLMDGLNVAAAGVVYYEPNRDWFLETVIEPGLQPICLFGVCSSTAPAEK